MFTIFFIPHVQFTPLLTRHAVKYAHHAELYLCKITNRATQLGFNNKCYLNPGACSSRTLITAWAVGGSVSSDEVNLLLEF